jgi:hypothetical protein
MGEIERNIEIMVHKGIILLRIKYLKERRGRISAEIAADLVYFVQDKHGIIGFRPLDTLDNAARKRPYIGAAMSSYLRLVPHSPQGNAHKLTAEGVGNGEGK